MILEYPVLTWGEWLAQRSPVFGIILVVLVLLSLLTAFVLCALKSRPTVAFREVLGGVYQAGADLSGCSARRIGAIARLVIKESLRSYVVVIPAVFLLVLAFAGWFLSDRTENPARLYVSFVLKLTGFLTMVMAIFLSVFSIPNDIKNKTIFTVVSKPVRAWEIILGRLVGFSLIGTLILLPMGLISYLWVLGTVVHQHTVDESSLRVDREQGLVTGRTRSSRGHSHTFSVRLPGEDQPGRGQTLAERGHYHPVEVRGTVDAPEVVIGRAEGALQARVPVYADLEFLDRQGNRKNVGINVGKEWFYRGYIEGQTLCAGIFHFQGLESRDFRRGLPLEMTIRVFRTYKGEIERGIRGTLLLRNPALNDPQAWSEASKNADVAKESEPITFIASDMTPESLLIPRRIEARMPDDSLREVDIFESLVHQGKLDLVIQCDERAQYLGMARTDLYLRAADRLFGWNFFKTCITIWLRMLIVIALGVMYSTFLAGPVAMLAVVFTLLIGFFAQNITDLAIGKTPGGGPLEATIRTFTQENLITELDLNTWVKFVIRVFDNVSLAILRGIASLMPNFGDFAERGGIETSRFVAYGFDIPAELMRQHIAVALMYVVLCTCWGYFLLKAKEVAA